MWDTPFDLSMLEDEDRKLIVSCPTKELAEEFVQTVHEHGVSWARGEGASHTNWNYGENTCYYIDRSMLLYGEKDYADGHRYQSYIKCTFYGVDTPDFEVASDDEMTTLLGVGGV